MSRGKTVYDVQEDFSSPSTFPGILCDGPFYREGFWVSGEKADECPFRRKNRRKNLCQERDR